MTPAAQNIKLRRTLLDERRKYKALLSERLESANYDRWVSQTKAAIDEINRRIRATNKAEACQ